MIVVVPVDPPHEALAPDSLLEYDSFAAADWPAYYRAMVADVVNAVASSGGDLLINYRDEETLPDDVAVEDPEAAVRAMVLEALGDIESLDGDAEVTDGAEAVRFERQVGSTRAARVGNTVAHLLEREEVQSVGVLEPTAPLVGRTEIDGVAMSLRRNEVVLGPSQGGDVYLAAFTEPIDFTDAFAEPAVSTLTARANDAGLGVGFAPRVPTVTDRRGLVGTAAEARARRLAGRVAPERTLSALEGDTDTDTDNAF
ncbi:hypothetical protein ACFQO4_03620 [Saliphagus sp. GCM10025334]